MNIAPENAKIKNETRRSKAWAKYPTNGGPINVPTIPYVAITEIAIPGEYFFDPEASVNVIGIIAAVPKPVRQNPISDSQNVGNKTASRIPKNIKQALKMYVLAMPIHSTRWSEAK